ncbi:MAG: CHASE2 domain-containing protein, partial [Cyanobacteriota bacterium]
MPKKELAILVIIVLTILLNISGVFDSLNESIYNYYLYANRVKTTNQDIVLVKIDARTLKKLKTWPLKREYYISVIENVIKSRPAVIGIVMAFTDKSNLFVDSKLYKTLKSFNHTVIIAKQKKDTIKKFTVEIPEKSIFPTIKHGHATVNYSNTSTVVGYEPYKIYPAFALQVSSLYFKHIKKPLNSLLSKYITNKTINKYSANEIIFVNYKRTPDMFESVSFIDVLNNNVNFAIFKDKIVLIGITDRFNTTSFSTPFTSINKTASTALEMQAQFIDSIINFKDITIVNNFLLYPLSVLITVLFYLFTRKGAIILQGLYLLLIVILIINLNYIMFTFFTTWFLPILPLSLLLSIFATYIYLTSFNIDNQVRESLESLQSIDSLNLKEIPKNVNSKVETLTQLIEIINYDRQTIKVIVDGVNSAIFVFNDNGIITWQNLRFKNDFSNNFSENINVENFIENFKLSELVLNIEQQGYYKSEHAIGTRDYICYVNLICNKDKKEYVAILNDITELKEIDRLKTDMVRMVSHELKNPLTGIHLSAENILDENDRQFTEENASSILRTT